jgi:hypothetical protein
MSANGRWWQGYRSTMSDDIPPPPSDAPAPPPPPPVSAPPPPAAAPGYGVSTTGRVPERLGGPFYSIGIVILLSIVTLSVWTFLWAYRTGEDLKKYNGDGLGGWLTVILRFVFWPIILFTIPNEIKNMYERDGRESPVTALWGLWILLPLIGWIIWYVKVQNALNDFWLTKGALPG